jgi:hypothetical protein
LNEIAPKYCYGEILPPLKPSRVIGARKRSRNRRTPAERNNKKGGRIENQIEVRSFENGNGDTPLTMSADWIFDVRLDRGYILRGEQ